MAILQLKEHRRPLLWVPKLYFSGIFDLQKQKTALTWPMLQLLDMDESGPLQAAR